jgi:hypothetical protein
MSIPLTLIECKENISHMGMIEEIDNLYNITVKREDYVNPIADGQASLEKHFYLCHRFNRVFIALKT